MKFSGANATILLVPILFISSTCRPTLAQPIKPAREAGATRIVVTPPAKPFKMGKNIFTLTLTPPPTSSKNLTVALMMMPEVMTQVGQPMAKPTKEPKRLPIVLRPGNMLGTYLVEASLSLPGTWTMQVDYAGDSSTAVFDIPVSFR
jgi:hypothetical protein